MAGRVQLDKLANLFKKTGGPHKSALFLCALIVLPACVNVENRNEVVSDDEILVEDSAELITGVHSKELYEGVNRLRFPYLQYLPKGYEERETWPLVLTLHHAGAPGKDLVKVAEQGIPQLVEAGRDFPFITVAPQMPYWSPWNPTQLSQFLDHIEATLKVDRNRIYVTGISLGGFGTWDLAAYEPERFAAIAPICGGGNFFHAKRLVDMNIWAFHGDRDFVVDAEHTIGMVAAVKREGGKPRLTVYKGEGHYIAEKTLANPEFFEWLLSHKLD